VFGFCLTALRAAVRKTDMATPGGTLVQRAARRVEHPGQGGFRDRSSPAPQVHGAHGPREPFIVRELPGPVPDLPSRPAPRAGDAGPSTSWQAKDPLKGPFLRIARTYIAYEIDDGFELVDQHALHERVTYEDAEAVRTAGIELSVFGVTTVALGALPVRLEKSDPEELVHGVVDVLRRSGGAPDAEALLGDVLHSAACRGSVMAGDVLSDEEIRALLERAASIEHDQTCPHGRPTRVRFTQGDLETAFLRK